MALKFEYQNIDLPVVEIVPDFQQQLKNENTLIVSAPPGAGKSTILPLTLLGEEWLGEQKIIMLEPRRLAARTIAERMASLLNEKVGKTVGYRIRFDNKVSEQTKIEVVTEGILTRMLHADNALEGVGCVLFDEFHERSIFADVALALCHESQQVLRNDLRMVIMSATLNIPQLTEKLNAPVVESKGRQYPIEIKYGDGIDLRLIPELVAQAILKAKKEQQGDILAFLPGEGEIKKCEQLLQNEKTGCLVYPLYGLLAQGKQRQAILPDREGRRKIILATSIAETSLTIEGVKVVVDCGYTRTAKFDLRSGLSRLETVQVSKDSADQRAGRAGRLGPGVCYRLWSQATHNQLAEHRTPEIMEADLANLVLDLAQWGINDPMQLIWLTPPSKGAIAQAIQVLHDLNALENGKITAHGKALHRLPCHPRIAHMLLMAKEEGMLSLATDIAAVLEERDPMPDAGIDINIRIETLRRQRKENRLSKAFFKVEKIAESYRRLMNCDIDNGYLEEFETGFLLVFAYPERIAHARVGNNAQFKLSNGKIAMAGHKDDLAHESWLAVAHMNARDEMGKIFLASPLNPRDLQSLVKEVENISWNTKNGGITAAKELRIGNIVLQSLPLDDPSEEEIVEAISLAVAKEGERLLNFNEEVEQWQNRVLSVRKWNKDEIWPDVSTNTLLQTNKVWLSPYLHGIKKPEDLKKLNLLDILHYSLDAQKQAALNTLAPTRIKVPSGSNLKIKYEANGNPPILAVRLQEVFGLAETSRINGGKQALLMHLLSPGYKPVQITSDLKNFWDNTYFEVKKELKRRYPKHAWPDDPWSEKAVRK